MRLYTRTGATQVSAGGTVYTGADGVFEFPQDVGAELHSFHMGGKPAWEDDAERAARVKAEREEKLRDPATMLEEMQKMTAGQGALATLLATALGAAQPTPEPEQPEQATPEETEAVTPEASSESAPGLTEPPSDPAPKAKAPRARKTAAAKSAASAPATPSA